MGKPRNTRKYPTYPEIPESKKDTRKYPIVFFDTPTRPEPDLLPGILSTTQPDLTRYWKTLPAGHWPEAKIFDMSTSKKNLQKMSSFVRAIPNPFMYETTFFLASDIFWIHKSFKAKSYLLVFPGGQVGHWSGTIVDLSWHQCTVVAQCCAIFLCYLVG